MVVTFKNGKEVHKEFGNEKEIVKKVYDKLFG